MSQSFRGIGVSSGVAVGRALVLDGERLPVVPEPIPPERVEEEIRRFADARQFARCEIEEIRGQILDRLGTVYAGILDPQRLILDDPNLVLETEGRIRIGRVSASWALQEFVTAFSRRLAGVDNDYIRDRAAELADVHRRLQRILRKTRTVGSRSPDGGPVVVLAHSVGPSDALLLARPEVSGLATDVGGRTSHIAILAQALGLPAVVGLRDASRFVKPGAWVVIDGDSGTVVAEPETEDFVLAESRRSAHAEREHLMTSERELASVTLDGVEVTLRANIEFPNELDGAQRYGAKGVGLYRSEFLFLSRAPALPTEEEHFEIACEIASRVAPNPAIIRTLDFGGEKYFREVLARDDANPVLGLRGVRLCLRRLDLFRPQLRGLLRAAAAHENLALMLPLVTDPEEVQQIRHQIADEVTDLRAQGLAARHDVALGVMIEVPAAALAVDQFMEVADFFCIGTNDLVQYALAVDRGHESLSDQHDWSHPGVLRLIHRVVTACHEAGRSVAVCGEVAAQPASIELLLGLGVRELSVQPRMVAVVRRTIRSLEIPAAKMRAEEALRGKRVPASAQSSSVLGLHEKIERTNGGDQS